MSDSAGPEEWAEGDVADNHRYIGRAQLGWIEDDDPWSED
jgi:hypothetical protein